MKTILGLAVVLGIIGTGAAFAQTTATPAAVIAASPDAKTIPPVAGANSFTEAEARHRLEANGYINVSDLRKDDHSVWHGKAMKGGTSVNVALDYQGTIVVH